MDVYHLRCGAISKGGVRGKAQPEVEPRLSLFYLKLGQDQAKQHVTRIMQMKHSNSHILYDNSIKDQSE